MTTTKNRLPGVAPRASGSMDYDSTSSAKVVPFRQNLKTVAAPFDQLTARTLIAQHRAGTLPEAVLVAIMAGVGLHP